jgi:hypothetical protein
MTVFVSRTPESSDKGKPRRSRIVCNSEAEIYVSQ